MSAGTLNVVGQGVNRVEGRAKVTGRARYAADNRAPGVVHAAGVFSTIASGRIAALDLSAAERAPGVLAVLHHGNTPPLHRSPNEMEENTRVGEVRPPFEDENIYYAGQFVALVVAETLEQARIGSRLVRVAYDAATPLTLTVASGELVRGTRRSPDNPDYARGDAAEAWASARGRIDVTYRTPVEVHNPMELHASVAVWHGERLEIHESTQWVAGQKQALAKVLGVPAENVTVMAPYVGGGFGGKLFLLPHTVLAAVAARQIGRPVKLVVERQRMFTTVGHRPATRQRVRLGADSDGRLLALQHDTVSQTSLVHDFPESSGQTTRSLYGGANVAVTHRLVSGNVGTPTPMRAPGAGSGMVALEGAMDELALALGLDPIELRRRNIPDRDEHRQRPWSGNRTRECCEIAARRFGWERRTMPPGSMREGDEILGWGFGLASWTAERDAARAKVELRADGSARIECATQDIGTGTYTIMAQTAAEITGLPLERIEVAIGHSDFPEGPISGGSMATASVCPAVIAACRAAIRELIATATKDGAPFAGRRADTLEYWTGAVISNEDGRRATIGDVLRMTRMPGVEGEGQAEPGEERAGHTFRSFGAHCVEVRWDPRIARLRVSRIVSAFDVGRVMNEKLARSQICGSLVMGLGMALLEESVYDERNGRVITDNLADYLVPVHADMPAMEVSFLNVPDERMGGFGARGLGEIGITGIGGAIINAVHHATGRRIRDLPITIEKLLA